VNDRTGGNGLAVLVMLIAPLIFSTNLIFGRAVIHEVAPFTLAFIRWGLVGLALFPFLWRDWTKVAFVLKRRWRLVLVLGFLGMWVCGGVVYYAIAETTATNGTLIYTTTPVIIIALEALFFGRKVGLREALGLLVAFIGVGVIVLRGDFAALAALEFNVGDLLFVASAVAWAVYSLFFRTEPIDQLPNLTLSAVMAAAGALTLFPVAAWEFANDYPMPVTQSAWIAIVAIVIISSLLAFNAFQYGVQKLGASLAGIFMYLLPIYGVGMAVIFLDETFHTFHAVGIALVLGGVILATFPVTWLRQRLAA
jgi:drug/metabolite transporter (DMT)-like permease